MEKLKSTGKCIFCQKEFTKAGISRHLETHLSKTEKQKSRGHSYHLRIEPDTRWGAAPYFLNVLADGATTFEALDDFLRKIWLDCCGHMSAFTHPQKQQQGGMRGIMKAFDLRDNGNPIEFGLSMENANGEIPKRKKLRDVLHEASELQYEYDFGSSTQLQLTVLKEFPYAAKKIELLSRNEPLNIMCDSCGAKPATVLCSVCAGYEDAFFCKDCAEEHEKTCDDFADYAEMPVVNSPRMGVCAYEGGMIDTERDKPYGVAR